MRALILLLATLPLSAQVYLTGGISATSGLGYHPVAPTLGIMADMPRLRAQVSWSPAHKVETGDGSNLRAQAWYGRSLIAGATVSHQRTSRWSKTALYPNLGYRYRALTTLAYLPDPLTANHGHGIGGTVDIRSGRLLATIGATCLRFRQSGRYEYGWSVVSTLGYRVR